MYKIGKTSAYNKIYGYNRNGMDTNGQMNTIWQLNAWH